MPIALSAKTALPYRWKQHGIEVPRPRTPFQMLPFSDSGYPLGVDGVEDAN
jgi:hypothetical protein